MKSAHEKVLNMVKSHIKDKKGVKPKLPYKFLKNEGAQIIK